MQTTPTALLAPRHGHPQNPRRRATHTVLRPHAAPSDSSPERGMRVLVTGSSGHLGEAMVRTLRARGADVVSLDARPSPWTSVVGSVNDSDLVRQVMAGVEVVFHMAAQHKPQLAFLPGQAFVDTNISGTHTCWRPPPPRTCVRS